MSTSTSPTSLPPILPSLSEELEKYLTDPSDLPIHKTEHATKFWDRIPQPTREYQVSHGPLSTTIQVERDLSGTIVGFKEVDISDTAGKTAKNSTSMRRAPGAPNDSTRGNSMNFLFWPGGFESEDLPEIDTLSINDSLLKELDNPEEYLTCAPNLPEGIDFHKKSEKTQHELVKNEILNLTEILTGSEMPDELASIWTQKDPVEDINSEQQLDKNNYGDYKGSTETYQDDLAIEDNLDFTKKTTTTGAIKKESLWAELIDITQPMLDFHQKVPNMAYNWPFELDTFQKQAVWHLENNDCVFVAAHTSAGKTVVAEYAIALSKKHMTRTIYTSPIKALSNQKFRDFKDTFEDVGLVTGDIQINPTATCLIMTTEILRSMLYNGSDIIRDLEYVVFDEVHYINDRERGVVWEEVNIFFKNFFSISRNFLIIILSYTIFTI